jgi:hypothetical protein
MVITMNVLKPILNKNLNSPEIINQFAEDFIFLQNKWSQLTYEQRMSNIVEMVSKAQKSIGVPAAKVEPNAESGHAGEFFNENWLIRVDSKLLKNNVLFPENAEELAVTLYHEIRHSEQYFRIAQKEALKFNDNGKSKNFAQITLETGIDERITKQAVASVQNLAPEQKKQLLRELAITDPWYRSLYPKTPAEAEANNKLRSTLASTYKLAFAAQEKYDFARNHTRQFSWKQIDELQAGEIRAKRQYQIARIAFIKGLPEEADAEATENKFRSSYISKLSSTRQRNTQNAKPSTSRNKSEEDWTDKFYNRGTNRQLSVEEEVHDQQNSVLQSDKSVKNIESTIIKSDDTNNLNLYQKLSQIAEKMPHNLVKLGLDPQNSQHREIFMAMYAINTGIDPHQLLANSPYNDLEVSGKTNAHTESIISQATAKIDEAAKASISTPRNIDRGLE